MSARYRQADPRWSAEKLGFGPSTIGRSGCLLVCLCEAARELRGVELLPPFLNAMGIKEKAFLHSMALTEKLGTIAGLRIGEKIVGDAAMLRGVVRDTFAKGGLSILHVDHTKDIFGDHFILALKDENDASGNRRILYSDSATGRESQLDGVNLVGSTTWGTQIKNYRAISVRSVFKA